ncbi:WD40 repeat-like protein, partial [Athelia psychrophila]
LQGHEKSVLSVAFSPEGSKIVSGSSDRTVRVWDALTGKTALPPLQGHDNFVLFAAFSPDGSRIVSGSEDRTVRVWDALTGQEAFPPLQGHNRRVKSVAFSSGGSKIVMTSVDGDFRIWDTLTGEARIPSLPSSPANGPAQSLVTLGKDDYFVEVSTGRYLSKVPAGFCMTRFDMLESGHAHGSSSRGFGWRVVNGQRCIPVAIIFS